MCAQFRALTIHGVGELKLRFQKNLSELNDLEGAPVQSFCESEQKFEKNFKKICTMLQFVRIDLKLVLNQKFILG